jgi:hypothetical protein
MAMALLTLLVVFSAPAFPQDQTETAPSAVAEQALPAEADSQDAAVEAILMQQEQLLRGQRFSYEPGNRRDPFESLYERIRAKPGVRPPGIQGMYIDEIDLNGIVLDPSGGDVAYFTGSDSKGYFLRIGDRVYDGAVIAIDPRRGAVTFRQQIDDPRRIKPYRDVVRTLEPLEGEHQ